LLPAFAADFAAHKGVDGGQGELMSAIAAESSPLLAGSQR
jgi:hypothetical protein